MGDPWYPPGTLLLDYTHASDAPHVRYALQPLPPVALRYHLDPWGRPIETEPHPTAAPPPEPTPGAAYRRQRSEHQRTVSPAAADRMSRATRVRSTVDVVPAEPDRDEYGQGPATSDDLRDRVARRQEWQQSVGAPAARERERERKKE